MPLPLTLCSALSALLRDRCSTDPAICAERVQTTIPWPSPKPPHAVVWPETTAEVAAIMQACASHRTPVVARGAGTSLEGQVQAVQGGVMIDFSRMNRVVSVSGEDLHATVQPGLCKAEFNAHLRPLGLWFPAGPWFSASLGGMAATRASGLNAVRYGTLRENVVALEVVLADGRVIRTARRAAKSSAGYDLTHLFVGSEGTLGLITELTMRVQPLPPDIGTATVSFPSLDAALAAAIAIAQAGIPAASLDVSDRVQMEALRLHAGWDGDVADLLFLEFHGTSAAIAEQLTASAALAKQHGGSAPRLFATAAEREELWRVRAEASRAAMAMEPGSAGLVSDVCVPRSQLRAAVAAATAEIAAAGLRAPLVSHAGDGNFHCFFLLPPGDAPRATSVKRCVQRIVAHALKLGGTCSGEHGIGLGKRQYLPEEHGGAVDVMRSIKTALDPQNLLNPGKLLPEPGGVAEAPRVPLQPQSALR